MLQDSEVELQEVVAVEEPVAEALVPSAERLCLQLQEAGKLPLAAEADIEPEPVADTVPDTEVHIQVDIEPEAVAEADRQVPLVQTDFQRFDSGIGSDRWVHKQYHQRY